MDELKTCPFCGSYPKLSFKEVEFYGRNYIGDKKSKYRVQMICKRCHARSKPIKTDYLINCNPHKSNFENSIYEISDLRKKQTEMIRPWVEQAVEAWNRRIDNVHV